MLHDLNSLIDTPVAASDGATGPVRDFLFDDRSWEVRHLVVEVGNWLQRRDVILPFTALAPPDWARGVCHVRLTKEQIRNSPDTDTEQPVSRQQELAMRTYFGSLSCWMDSGMGMSFVPVGVRYPVKAAWDPHLRSARHILGYTVWAIDGDLGRLEGLVLDEARWHLSYLDVKAGAWQRERRILVPTGWVESISWPGFRIYLNHRQVSV
ncbi:MAG TPA: PRC-barrel domain-containing protein [Terracidiphilus sp.]|nr:PRC-barrel domain-containing protein [Terracidiphilus sp.]